MLRPHRGAHNDLDALVGVLPDGYAGAAVVLDPGVGFVLVGGERRTVAQKARGDRKIVVAHISTWKEWVAWMMLDVQFSARYGGTPWSIVDAAYLDLKVQKLLKPSARAGAPADMAEYTGQPPHELGYARRLLAVATDRAVPDDVQRLANEHFASFARGSYVPSSAWNRFSIARRKAARPGMAAAEQRKLLNNVVPLLAGATDGLASLGDLSPDLTAGECADWRQALAETRLQLERVVRRLKEREA